MKRWNERWHEKYKTYSLINQVYEYRNLEEAFKAVRANKGAPGVDGVTIEQFEQCLEQNLREIQRQLKERRYSPQPVKRVYIPKANGGQRPLGIPTVKDRVVQQALKRVLEPIFERIFLNGSYGYRPGRSAQQAVARAAGIIGQGYWWVVDADIKGFFDNVNHEILLDLVNEQVSYGKVLKLIRLFLESGVLEGDTIEETPTGTPQGGVISPLLANIMLNHLDRRLGEEGYIITRYADDCAPRNCTEDEGGSLGAGLQEQAPNHPKLHGSKALVVSVGGKGMAATVSGTVQGDEEDEPPLRCRKRREDVETGNSRCSRKEPRGQPADCLGGIRHRGGVNLHQAFVWNVGTCSPDAKGETQMVAP